MEQTSTQLWGQSSKGAQGSEGVAGSAMISAYTACTPTCDVSVPPLRHYQDITCDWLTRALQVGDRTIADVADFSMTIFTQTAYDSTVRLDLSYADTRTETKPGPASALCKIFNPAPVSQLDEPVADTCRRETAAYLELKYHDVCRMPTLLLSTMDACCYTLLLREDSGALPVSQYTPELRFQMDAVLRELALLHGSFARQSPVSAPAWLLRPRDSAELIGEQYRKGCHWLARHGSNSLCAEHWQVIAQFADQVVAWNKFERHILTITHGDMRSDNLLYYGNESACRATLIDWKQVGLRNPMFDVACLLGNSLTVEQRRDSEMVLLERYRRQFEQSGISYAGVDAHDDYRFHLFAPLIFNVCAATPSGEAANPNSTVLNNIARNCQAVIDWNAHISLKELN